MNKHIGFSLVTLSLLATPAMAQTEALGVPVSGNYEPKSLRLSDGALTLTPTLAISAGKNNNVRRASSGEVSSTFLSLSPALKGEAAYGANRYTASYQADLLRYQSSSNDNTTAQDLAVAGSHDIATRVGLQWRLGWQDQYDAIGETDRTISAEPDHWQASSWSVSGRYGAASAIGRLYLDLGQIDKAYQNNRSVTAQSDVATFNAALRFLARVAPNTDVVAEYRRTRLDFDLNATNRDNTERRLLLGLQWEATAATSGSLKVGRLTKQYDAVRPKFSGFTWEGMATWQPLSYSRIDLNMSRSASDSEGSLADYLVTNSKSITWTHTWASALSTRLNVGRSNVDYIGDTRADNTDQYILGADYVLARNVRLSADWQHSDRSSSVSTSNFKQNQVSMTMDLAF